MILPMVATAAGTYYNTASQQRSYSSYAEQRKATTQNSGYKNYANPNVKYSTSGNVVGQQTKNVQVAKQQPAQIQSPSNKKGFYMGLGITHESAMWEFEMQQAGSKLHYDNIGWNVLDINAGYKFDTSLPFQIDAGFKYGMQSSESTMIDDDITHGGIAGDEWKITLNPGTEQQQQFKEHQVTRAMSVGTTKGGNMMEFNVGMGLTDVFKIGRLKMTPSIGYRYLKYKLHTESNYGMAIDTIDALNYCLVFPNTGETQCSPMLVFFNPGSGAEELGAVELIDLDGDRYADVSGVIVPSDIGDYTHISTENTYYYQQPGTSHEYDVTWAGPYVALDMEYDINQNNSANMRVELGFPGYKAEGDQPYRPDWQHPKSVEDEAKMFGALHLGLAANWMTAITDTISLSLGVTYDYYKTSKADATTYFDSSYYMPAYNALLAKWINDTGLDEATAERYMLNGGSDGEHTYIANPTAVYINGLRNNGWKETIAEEIKSVYRSLGVRVGVAVKF
ncbi:MAG: hypothetical protein MJ170_01430 [Alphaproteobacteria bacterium]|nr:hypothetical protein [Alphaproteobacteria bacterium]